MHTRTHVRILTGGLALLTMTACSSVAENLSERAAEEILEQAAGGEVDLDLDEDGGTVSVSTDDGSFTVGGGDLPDNFPASAPLPDGYTVLTAMSGSDDEGSETLMVNLSVQDVDFEDLTATFESDLAANGWEITERSEMTGDVSQMWFAVTDGAWSGQIAIIQSGSGGFNVNYTLETDSE